MGAEDGVPGGRAHEEVRKGPLGGHKNDEEHRSRHRGMEPTVAPGQVPVDEVEGHRRNDHEQRKVQRDHVRDGVEDRAQLGLRGKEREEPKADEPGGRIDPGHDRTRPLVTGGDRGTEEGYGSGQRKRPIKRGAVHEVAIAMLPDEHEGQDQEHRAHIEEETVELRLQLARGAVHVAEDQHERADPHRDDPQEKHGMGRADDLDIQPIGVVPPVVERGGGQHGEAAPGADERAQRPIEPEDADRSRTRRPGTSKSAGQDEIGAGDRGQHAAKVDREVRGGQERVAADRHVPGDIPIQAAHDRGHGQRRAPEIPGDGRRVRVHLGPALVGLVKLDRQRLRQGLSSGDQDTVAEPAGMAQGRPAELGLRYLAMLLGLVERRASAGHVGFGRLEQVAQTLGAGAIPVLGALGFNRDDADSGVALAFRKPELPRLGPEALDERAVGEDAGCPGDGHVPLASLKADPHSGVALQFLYLWGIELGRKVQDAVFLRIGDGHRAGAQLALRRACNQHGRIESLQQIAQALGFFVDLGLGHGSPPGFKPEKEQARCQRLGLRLEAGVVLLEKGPDVVGHAQKLRPLLLVEGDGEAAQPVDR